MIDIHNHTTFSDGRNTVEQVIQSAVEAGLQVIGLSDHFDPYVCQEVCLQPEQINGYLKKIRSFDGKLPIKVLAGLELGLQSEGILLPGEEMDY
ncbi:MAG: PHP domain-containing protein, partial [Mesotoga sp.]